MPLRKIPSYYYSGKRKDQMIHARLRTNSSSLASDLFSKNIVPSPLCVCGQRETSLHFFFHCPRYANIRVTLMNSVNRYCIVTQNILLFGDPTLSDDTNEQIFRAVHQFIQLSKRFDWSLLFIECSKVQRLCPLSSLLFITLFYSCFTSVSFLPLFHYDCILVIGLISVL